MIYPFVEEHGRFYKIRVGERTVEEGVYTTPRMAEIRVNAIKKQIDRNTMKRNARNASKNKG